MKERKEKRKQTMNPCIRKRKRKRGRGRERHRETIAMTLVIANSYCRLFGKSCNHNCLVLRTVTYYSFCTFIYKRINDRMFGCTDICFHILQGHFDNNKFSI
jgi:hypothetical protein